MEDFFKGAPELIAAVGAAFTAAGTWVMSKFKWWKESDSKLVKIGVPLATFILVMLVLSALQKVA